VREQHARLREMVDEHIHIVARTLRKAGVPPSDLDDEIQRTFMVAAARLEVVQRGAERSFLCQVAYNVASHARRRLARRREVLDGHPPERIEAVATPEFLTDRKQLRRLLDEILGSLHESLRVVFTLFELEDMNLIAIAKRLGLPRGTVASRLRRARAQLRAHAAAVDLGELRSRSDDATETAEPTLLRRERVSALQAAILGAGARTGVSATTYGKTLEALGFESELPEMSLRSRSSRVI
jgi:RNA polymerase sigma-70 factor, ECF subfamily